MRQQQEIETDLFLEHRGMRYVRKPMRRLEDFGVMVSEDVNWNEAYWDVSQKQALRKKAACCRAAQRLRRLRMSINSR